MGNETKKNEYVVHATKLMHDKKMYQVGQTIMLTDKEVASLRSVVCTPEEYAARKNPERAADELKTLKQRVAELEKDNEELDKENADLVKENKVLKAELEKFKKK